MASEWDAWLRQLAADQQGALGLPGHSHMKSIVRGDPYEWTFWIGADVSGDSFDASLRLGPDTGVATAFSVAVGDYEDGFTAVTVSLSEAQISALPADDDVDGLEEMAVDIRWTPSGHDRRRMIAGVVRISGKA